MEKEVESEMKGRRKEKSKQFWIGLSPQLLSSAYIKQSDACGVFSCRKHTHAHKHANVVTSQSFKLLLFFFQIKRSRVWCVYISTCPLSLSLTLCFCDTCSASAANRCLKWGCSKSSVCLYASNHLAHAENRCCRRLLFAGTTITTAYTCACCCRAYPREYGGRVVKHIRQRRRCVWCECKPVRDVGSNCCQRSCHLLLLVGVDAEGAPQLLLHISSNCSNNAPEHSRHTGTPDPTFLQQQLLLLLLRRRRLLHKPEEAQRTLQRLVGRGCAHSSGWVCGCDSQACRVAAEWNVRGGL